MVRAVSVVRTTLPKRLVSWSVMAPVLVVVAVRLPSGPVVLRVQAPVVVSSMVQRGLSPVSP